jgi:glycine dehydrogenase subunit 2
MLMEPTETESKASLDQFADALLSLARRARSNGDPFHAAPIMSPRRRLDETRAARTPVLRWRPSVPKQAAE